jgi:hypothetical protein
LEKLNAHRYFQYNVNDDERLQWERKTDAIEGEEAHDGWYPLHTNLEPQAPAGAVLAHYKKLLEVESAFCEPKS